MQYLAEFVLDTEKFKWVMWCVILGIVLSWIVTFYNKKICGAITNKLLALEAFSPETSKTLADIGVSIKSQSAKVLKSSEPLKRIVKYEGELNENTPLYISEDMKKRAEMQYGETGKELITMIIGLFVLLAVGAIITAVFV